jgi:hypothetical protein
MSAFFGASRFVSANARPSLEPAYLQALLQLSSSKLRFHLSRKKDTRLAIGKAEKKAFDSLETALSNSTLAFVFNKTF